MRSLLLGAVVIGLVATGCTKKAGSGGDGTEEGVAAANAWLEVIDEGRYSESWEQACEYFRRVVPKEQWEQQAAGVRGPLGEVVTRELDSAEYTTKLPGAPDGEYVVIRYKTQFANKASSIETVTPMRDPDGVFRVSGYYIR